MGWRRFALLMLLALLAPGLSAAQSEDAPRGVSIVVYHAHPDPAAGTARADPFSSPVSPPSPRLPRTLVDGVLEASDAPQGDPASPSTHFLEMRALVQARQRASPPTELTLSGRIDGDRIVAASSRPNVTMLLVEDGIEHDGDSGVRVHRFVARAAMTPGAEGAWEAPLDPSWSRARLAVVAWLPGEEGVVQSATWRATQEGPTVQVAHAALVEHWTATWCAPCAASDHALALLATQSGLPLEVASRSGYAEGATPLLLVGLAAGGALGLAVVWRRRA